jgi:GT2 family glycosyltransferase
VADDGVVAVTVTLNGLPWIERCLESLVGLEVVVVDHGSTDGTLGLVRERFPDARVIEQGNDGYGAGLNAGFRASSPRYWLVLNSDAWVVDGAVDRLVAFADAHSDAAVVAPRLRNPDGTLQRSVRGFPTLWRLATEYFFLRKLAPRSHALNAFYAGDFDHGTARAVEWVMGSCFLVRRSAVDQVGLLDEDFFLFSEETDWFYRFREAGWSVWFTPDAEAVHVGGATHGRWSAKNGGPRAAARARRLLVVALRLRGLLFRGERGRMYREAARAL